MVNTTVFNKKIVSFTGKRQATEGLKIGLEIEVEGTNLPRDFFRYWLLHDDGSLRGQDNAEYVLIEPINRREVPDALNYLNLKFKQSKAAVNEQSDRTSVHVHLNVSHWTIRQVMTFWVLYAIFEDLLFEVAGDERRGNLFCLRLKDSDYLLQDLKFGFEDGTLSIRENFRYSALNLASLKKHGSLEFRQLHGTVNIEEIERWVDILCCLYNQSLVFKDPQEVINTFSRAGYRGFFNEIFKNLPVRVKILLQAWNLRDIMFEGMRIAQDIAWMVPSWGDSNEKEELKKKKPVVDAPLRGIDEDPPIWIDGQQNINAQELFNRLRVQPVRARRLVEDEDEER